MKDSSLSNTASDEVTASKITPPADCKMCSVIIELFQSRYDHYDINLGKVSERLADDCPHATWLRDVEYNTGPVPFYEKRELKVSHSQRDEVCTLSVHYYNRQGIVWASTPGFKLVSRPEIPGHIGSLRIVDENWIDLDVVRNWLLRCTREHEEKCNKTVGDVPPFKPRLLIDVIQGCVTECKEERPRFLTLSYTWGNSKNLRITKANVDEMKQPGILTSEFMATQLPRTILNAIKLTQALGERWLWVDSLCITQDDDESLQHQLAAMHRIYATSFITIIAADGQDAEYGLRGLRDISNPREIKRVVLPLARGERIAWTDYSYSEEGSMDFSYDGRMWTSQEYYFSRRRLIFKNGQVRWECNCSAYSEDHLDGTQGELGDSGLAVYVGRDRHSKVPSLYGLNHVVCNFNMRALRYEEDVYNAFSGYNTYLNSIFPSGLVYGHPQVFFDISLCWTSLRDIRRRKVSERYTGDPVHRGLPSWSWMGWKGLIRFPFDSESGVGGTPNAGFTNSITEWYAMEYPASCRKQRIKSLWSQCQNLPNEVEAGFWRCEEFNTPALTSGSTRTRMSSDAITIPKELPSHGYTPLFDESPRPEARWYHVPVRPADSEDDTPSGLHSGYQYLWCLTFRAILTATDEKFYPAGQIPYHLLKNKDGSTVGSLLPHNEHESESLQQGTQVELIAIAKGWSTVLGEVGTKKQVSRTPSAETPLTLEEEQVIREEKEEYWSEFSRKFSWMDRYNEGKKKRQDGYHVLWIEWENGVAYRKGYGFVLEEEWDRVAETSRVDITLG
ncbi:hypothetical protein NW752_009543 [Fusarium irregulare]|uniref:Heterokaryon incompatibility domain-containing protein n=1 Tax=Fusarium irregulare TaxID=2494466 RepID=A0A9W8PG25_9HYPO|nr:hypothetical protein NW766_011524 [Fusarium irregulare]KAJ4009244.1 hypothetical protein NW752_009543 [Fusarium irregulare]